jgi:DNA-directed RNA polymerase subunit RPC12/RpoP
VGNSVIRFRCDNCGRKFGLPERHAGKTGNCPNCGNLLVVPKASSSPPAPPMEASDASRPSSGRGVVNASLLDLPQKKQATESAPGDSTAEQSFDEQLALITGHRTQPPEPPPARRLPWVIDVFFYPLNKPGLTMLAITVGVPLLLRALVSLLSAFAMAFPPIFVLLVLFIVLFVIAGSLFTLYIYWYMCDCIRDSACGGLRAPETAGRTPGLAELFWQTIQIVICLLFFLAPAGIYLLYFKRIDAALWALYACGLFFFPMGLLAVVMFESVSGLNPILIVGSIFSTFFQYCGLVILFYAVGLLVPVAGSYLMSFWPLGFAIEFVSFYTLLVLGHLVGRFYWKYQAKLNWEV